MRFRFSLKTILPIALLVLSACNSRDSNTGARAPATPTTTTTTAQETPQDGVRRVTIPELREALDKGEAVVVDVRGSVEYKLGHIKGARSVPLGLIAQQIKELPREQLIVTYCA
jgi:3-mercaptopyruvate sulfurtransferase SseA